MRGLYVITNHQDADLATLLRDVEAALAGGARYLQYRLKQASRARRESEAQALLALSTRFNVPLIINDDLDLAVQLGCGVHLGIADGDIALARDRLGPQAIVGATCHADLKLAQMAVANGASYVAFGRFFSSTTKPVAPPASLAVLTQARASLPVPICAIGGIDASNAPRVIAAGADLIAVIAGVFAKVDVKAAAQCLAALYAQ